jgi:hypothetical protein
MCMGKQLLAHLWAHALDGSSSHTTKLDDRNAAEQPRLPDAHAIYYT